MFGSDVHRGIYNFLAFYLNDASLDMIGGLESKNKTDGGSDTGMRASFISRAVKET